MRFPDSIKMEELSLQKFAWLDMDEFEMQLIKFQNSLIWKQKFIDLRVYLENTEKSHKRREYQIEVQKTNYCGLGMPFLKIFRA